VGRSISDEELMAPDVLDKLGGLFAAITPLASNPAI